MPSANTLTGITLDDPVASVHPTYGEQDEIWETIEDVCEGSHCVKRRGTRYLPELKGQEQDEYDAYKLRATFVGFTKRTREALAGLLLRKDPDIEFLNGEVEGLTEDITLAGHTITDWIRMVAEQGVSTGRCATVVDWSNALERPYLAFYKARDVLNWASVREDGGEKLVLLTVREFDEAVEEHLTVETRIKIRRFWIDPDSGYVKSDLWVQVANAEKSGTQGGGESRFQREGDEVELKRNGQRLTRIPAVIHNATHLGPEIGEAPLADIAEINVSHYRTSADLENGRHICGLPTPYATGVTDSGDLTLGAAKAWIAEDPAAKFGFLEFTGQGLGALEKALEEKAHQMALLGARLLFNDSNDAEAFETVQLRATSETAALGNISGHLSATLTHALQWFTWWTETGNQAPEDLETSIVLTRDFMASTMKPELLTALNNALQTSSLSMDTFFHQLKKGEIYPPDWDLEREVAAIAQRPVMTPPAAEPEQDSKNEPQDQKDGKEKPDDSTGSE